MYRLKGYMGYLKTLVIYFFAKIISVFCSSKYKNLWLISERGTDARDNGYVFFKYLCENHPETDCAYVISSDSADYPKVSALGKTVEYKSLKHYLCFINARVLISTHICGYTPNMYFYSQLDKRFGFIKQKKVFLQHGITKDDVAELHYTNIKLDLFACGAKREYEAVKSGFNHPDGVVKFLGFCRYDNLSPDLQPKKQILLMPTWRKGLLTCHTAEDFKKTSYYKHFEDFINDERVAAALEKSGYTMLFYPHYELQKYADAFEPASPLIKIAAFENYDVQRLLIDSAMLITDYSSVFFDVAYMKKPIIHYIFDNEEYRKTHYSQGYFDFEDSFGKAVHSHEELVAEFLRVMDGGLKPDKVYLDKTADFFGDISECCRERTFEAVRELLD